MEVSGQRLDPAALSHIVNQRYPLNTRLDGPQSRCRQFSEEKKLLFLPRRESSHYTDCTVPVHLTETVGDQKTIPPNHDLFPVYIHSMASILP